MNSQMSALLTSHLLQGTASHHSTFPQFLMVVTLVAIFFVNPLSFVSTLGGRGGPLGVHPSSGSMRTLNTLDSPGVVVDGDFYNSTDMAVYACFWVLRILIAAVCFGWMTLKSMPKIVANSNDAVRYWRFRKQAENDLLKVDTSTSTHT